MGKQYRDSDGDTWTDNGDGVLRCNHDPDNVFASRFVAEEAYGPLTEIPAEPTPPRRFRDNDGDVWAENSDGRYALRSGHRRIALNSLRDIYGPLTEIDTDGNPLDAPAPTADAARLDVERLRTLLWESYEDATGPNAAVYRRLYVLLGEATQ
jgi:hypothetical protein